VVEKYGGNNSKMWSCLRSMSAFHKSKVPWLWNGKWNW